jgi:two-component system, cell cycle response regulator DivK
LLVEDHVETREMYAEWLMFSGFRVAEAATVEEAIEKTLSLRPHVITTDLGLPGSDGRELCQRLKADERTREIPVIAVTAWAIGNQVERARSAGCDSVLLKPCLPEDLLKEIQRLLKGSKTAKTQR